MSRLRSLAVLAGATALVAGLTAAPASAAAPAGDYIVVLRPNATQTADDLAAVATDLGSTVKFVYRHALDGYAATLTQSALARMERERDVLIVERDQLAFPTVNQDNPPSWGLDRINQRFRPLDNRYSYNSLGGVPVYVIDTGIRVTHGDFLGKAVNAYDATGGNGNDCSGHGTHVAGTVGGFNFGVAKSALLFSVRVFGCTGGSPYSTIIRGVDWVTGNHQAGNPAVANMSLSGPASDALDFAVRNSINNDRITYVVAAGNDNVDACTQSPARVAEAITVGATDINDNGTWFTNGGACVDWFAPGQDIRSLGIANDLAQATMSGTSMAAPHVAGVAAQYLTGNGGAYPATVQNALRNLTTKNIVTNAKGAPAHMLFTNL
ncbi:MAG TPA: S8 family serine peptidase [Frankiaceae bacterium]|nr:S8 family serine peptidase [Frankiaceae bacterium]